MTNFCVVVDLVALDLAIYIEDENWSYENLEEMIPKFC